MSKAAQIFFVDDDPQAGDLFARFGHSAGLKTFQFQSPIDALEAFKHHSADLIITDLSMPHMNGIELLKAVREIDSDIPVIIITGYSSTESAIEALRLGAADFIKKPYDIEELLLQAQRVLEAGQLKVENRVLKRQLKKQSSMIGDSHAMQSIQRMIDKVACIRCNVIIEGESGTGKELVARALHEQGPEAEKPFMVIDCGALTDNLLESELFGHEKGAFTGAQATKQGLLEAASGGTVFLDEICNISDSMQTKLLRVVQEQQVTRVGGVRPIEIDVRFVCATNRNLEAMVAANGFRHDLYHRLNVVKIDVPPLRERREDIPELVQSFTQHFADRYQRKVDGFDADSLAQLAALPWPGNIRELRNVVERHIALADEPLLRLEQALINPATIKQQCSLDDDQPPLAELEKRYILKTLDNCQGNREQTASILGINKSTLWRKLQSYGHR